MEPSKRRFWISGGNDALAGAFEWLDERATDAGEALLVVRAKRSLNDEVADIIGASSVKALRNNLVAQLPSGGQLDLMTERLLVHSFAGPVLALVSSVKMLDLVEDIEGVTEILALPYYEPDVAEWARLWNVCDVRGDVEPAVENAIEVSPLLAVALSKLRPVIGDRVLRHKDRTPVVRLFERLHDAHEYVAPLQVKAWFLQHGYPIGVANAVSHLATDVQGGKKFRGLGAGWWRRDIVQQWRREVHESGDST